MTDEKTDEKKVESTDTDSSKNKDSEKDTQEPDVEDVNKDNVGKDNGKKEGDEEEVIKDPWEEKYKELEKDNTQKSAALVEKNKKLNDLKEKIKDKEDDGEEDTTNEEVTELKEQVKTLETSIETITKNSEETLRIAQESEINRQISQYSDHQGEQKIIKFYLDNKVNNDLPLEERIKQASILAKGTLAEDTQFQADVEKANNSSVHISGRRTASDGDIPEGAKQLADTLLQTDKGKKKFRELYREKHS